MTGALMTAAELRQRVAAEFGVWLLQREIREWSRRKQGPLPTCGPATKDAQVIDWRLFLLWAGGEGKEQLRIAVALREIERQVDTHPAFSLCLAVLKQAIRDAFAPAPRAYQGGKPLSETAQALRDAEGRRFREARVSALWYLCGEMPHAVAVGLDPEWVRSVLAKRRLDVSLEVAA